LVLLFVLWAVLNEVGIGRCMPVGGHIDGATVNDTVIGIGRCMPVGGHIDGATVNDTVIGIRTGTGIRTTTTTGTGTGTGTGPGWAKIWLGIV